MGRPRKHNLHLPEGVYFRHGAYYRVVRNKWHRIGTTTDGLALDPTRLPARLTLSNRQILEYAYKVLARARQNAKQRKVVGFSIVRDDVHRMLNEAGWSCAVTGMPFALEVVSGRKPYAPSIDRIDCAKGYTPDNCRVVCLAVNYAMNVWGEAVFRRMLTGLRERSLSNTTEPVGQINL